MKKKLIGLKILSILSLVILLSGCNDDEEKISAKQIRQALFDMKGTYHGSIEVAFYHGDEIKKIDNAKAKSRDSLSFVMPLAPIADIIDDNDGYSVHFVLIPENIVIPANGNTPDITIVLADTFGGDFEKAFNFIMFNVSPKEILVGGTKLDSFKQLVYHFRGEYE